MTVPTRNTALSPYPYGSEAALQNAIAYISGILPLTDEYGAALSVPMRGVYSGDTATFPEVVVTLESLGPAPFGTGGGVLNPSADGTHTIVGLKAENCIILLTVRALSDASRRFIADALYTGVPGGYMTMPTGEVIPNAIIHALRTVGLTLKGWESVRYPSAPLTDPRPEGQVWTAELRLKADMMTAWGQPIPGNTEVVSTVTPTTVGGQTLPTTTTTIPHP